MPEQVLVRKVPKGQGTAFTIGCMEAELTDDVIEDFKLRAALRRLGTALAKQYAAHKTRDGEETVVGVDLLTVGFRLRLAKVD